MKLGFVALFLSEPLVAGFTCASAFHVFTTQIKSCFGLSVPRQSAPFAIVKVCTHARLHVPAAVSLVVREVVVAATTLLRFLRGF